MLVLRSVSSTNRWLYRLVGWLLYFPGALVLKTLTILLPLIRSLTSCVPHVPGCLSRGGVVPKLMETGGQ